MDDTRTFSRSEIQALCKITSALFNHLTQQTNRDYWYPFFNKYLKRQGAGYHNRYSPDFLVMVGIVSSLQKFGFKPGLIKKVLEQWTENDE